MMVISSAETSEINNFSGEFDMSGLWKEQGDGKEGEAGFSGWGRGGLVHRTP